MKKELIKFLKKIIRNSYHKLGLGVRLNESIVKDLGGYFALDRKQILFYLKNGKKLNTNLWKISNPKTEKEIKEFYGFTPYYIFALAYWHMTKYQRNLRKNILNNSFGDVLDYGGGMGDLCLDLARSSQSVTYADVAGKTFNFAQWLFQEHKASVKMINIDEERIEEKYDTIVCLDVIEHVLDPETLLKDLVNSLKSKGKLIITNLEIKEISIGDPMHFKIKFNAKNYLESQGLISKDFDWLWIKK